MKKYLAELIATFALVFCGTGAVIINETSGGVITHPGVAITFGLIIMAMVFTLGDISGAHINPAVSIALAASKRFAWKEVLPYTISQIAGAVAASFILKMLFPQNEMLGSTIPAGSWYQSFILEFFMTFFLMYVILNVTAGAKEKGITAAIAIGSVIALDIMFAGPITGGSMNPARSLGPALISGHTEDLAVYLTAPVAGALFASQLNKVIRE